jgi:hypothetical protein
MKIKSALCLLTIFCCICIAEDAAEKSNDNKNKKEDFLLTIAFSKKTYSIDERIECAVRIKNISPRDIDLANISAVALYKFRIVAPNGKEAPITFYGQNRRDVFSAFVDTLKSGFTRTFVMLHLDRIYDMILAGEYRITVSRSILNEGSKNEFTIFTSNEETIQIIEPERYHYGSWPKDENVGEEEARKLQTNMPNETHAAPLPKENINGHL